MFLNVTSVRNLRQQGRTPDALLEYVIDFHRPMGGAKSVRKGSHDCLLIKSEEEPQFSSVQFLIKDVPINQLFKIGKASGKTFSQELWTSKLDVTSCASILLWLFAFNLAKCSQIMNKHTLLPTAGTLTQSFPSLPTFNAALYLKKFFF